MKSGDITRVTGVLELTWCYNCNNFRVTEIWSMKIVLELMESQD